MTYILGLRDRLIGTWEFQLESWRRNEEKQWVRAFMMYPTHIFVDPRTRKLRARVQQRQNEFFEDADFDTGILYIDENGSAYKLYLILNVKQELRGAYKAAAHMETVDMNLLVSLDINPRETGPSHEFRVKRMKGIWYDVDNVLWRLVAEANTEETMLQLWDAFDNNVNNFQGKIIADRTDLESV